MLSEPKHSGRSLYPVRSWKEFVDDYNYVSLCCLLIVIYVVVSALMLVLHVFMWITSNNMEPICQYVLNCFWWYFQAKKAIYSGPVISYCYQRLEVSAFYGVFVDVLKCFAVMFGRSEKLFCQYSKYMLKCVRSKASHYYFDVVSPSFSGSVCQVQSARDVEWSQGAGRPKERASQRFL